VREPGKAKYREFEDRPDLEFDFYLAEKLGMTVDFMRQNVSAEEYLGWSTYYKRKRQREELAMKMRK
jgi:hypothetical protein